MSVATQERLFEPAFDETRLGHNQRAVLAWIDRWGSISVRAAGRIVYRQRGHRDPDRVPAERVESAGWRVLLILKRHGLIACGWKEEVWRRRSGDTETP